MAVDIEEFRKEVYNVVASIPSGRVLSYGQIAWLVGCPRHARLIGKVLHGVSETENLPCHRVVNGNGRTAPCWEEQRGLLEAEGITFRANGCVDMRKWQWKLAESGFCSHLFLKHCGLMTDLGQMCERFSYCFNRGSKVTH